MRTQWTSPMSTTQVSADEHGQPHPRGMRKFGCKESASHRAVRTESASDRARTWTRSKLSVLLTSLLTFVAGCDPCFGTGACTDPHLAAEGRLIWHLDGSPGSGVAVEFRPESGSADTLRAYSNATGQFRLTGPRRTAGQVVGTLVFFPPEPFSQFFFGVPGVVVPTTTVRGDSRFLGTWGVGPIRTDPHISYVGELWYRDTGARAEGVEVEFRRTGGISVMPETLMVRSGADGRFVILLEVVPATAGELIGELHIRPSAPYKELTVTELRMTALFGLGDSRFLGVWTLES
jgi:hypothetical protein